MFRRIRLQHHGSFGFDLNELPQYSVTDREAIELQVVGSGFTVTAFRRIPRAVNTADGTPISVYILAYQYRRRDSSIIVTAVLFVGGKPRVFFLYEDVLRPDCPVKEYRLVTRNGEPTLVLQCEDAEHDAERSQAPR